MAITVIETALPDVKLIEPEAFGDTRGCFYESFNARDFCRALGREVCFVQDNHTQSRKHVLRGLHYQIRHPQAKLVRVIAGEIFDVVVDLRRTSPTFGQWVGDHLSADNRRQMWVPEGFAHGFLVLSESAEVLYKASDYWAPQDERILLWNDPDLAIDWPLGGGEPVLAQKDEEGNRWRGAECYDGNDWAATSQSAS
jgi:dTDP-4-dehydrorhamnose 3,5-epimerase